MSLKVDGVDVSVDMTILLIMFVNPQLQGSQQQSPRVPGLGDPIPQEGPEQVRQTRGQDHLLRQTLHQGVWKHELEGQ